MAGRARRGRPRIVVLLNAGTSTGSTYQHPLVGTVAGGACGRSVIASHARVVAAQRLTLPRHRVLLHVPVVALATVVRSQVAGGVACDAGSSRGRSAGLASVVAVVTHPVGLVLAGGAGTSDGNEEEGEEEQKKQTI